MGWGDLHPYLGLVAIAMCSASLTAVHRFICLTSAPADEVLKQALVVCRVCRGS